MIDTAIAIMVITRGRDRSLKVSFPISFPVSTFSFLRLTSLPQFLQNMVPISFSQSQCGHFNIFPPNLTLIQIQVFLTYVSK